MNTFFLKTFAASILLNSFIGANLLFTFKRSGWRYVMVPFFIIMAFIPLLNLTLDYNGLIYHTATRLETFWLAYATPLAFVLLLINIVYILRWVFYKCTKRHSPNKYFNRSVLWAMLLIIPLSIYGYYEANHVLQVETYELTSAKLSQDVRMVFIADIHINGRLSPERLQQVVNTANQCQPDIIILGGDIIDAPGRHKEYELSILQKLHAPSGKFAVLGNHEASYSLDESILFLQKAGLTLLRGQSVEVDELIMAGVDDPVVASEEESALDQALPLLMTLDQSKFIILAQHRPFIQTGCLGLFDLQLAGHNHGGHFWPVNHLLKLTKLGLANGLSIHKSQGGSSAILVTRGTGYGRTPLRIAIPPEIVVINLLGKQNKKQFSEQ